MKKNKIYILLTAALTFSLICGCTESETKDAAKKAEDIVQEISDQAENILDSSDEHVLGVKTGHPNTYPDITYGDAFDNFFGTPTWKYFEADTGEDVVEFTGYCTYHDVEVKARLQFILAEDGTITYGAMSFNDVPQTELITIAMLEAAFEDYMERNGISEDDSTANESAIVPPASDSAEDSQTSTTGMDVKPDISSLEGDYTRTNAPTCGLSIWTVDDSGILFALGIGTSGYASYVDLRECHAVWTDDKTAVYTNGEYQIEITVGDDGSLTFLENQPNPYNTDFPLSGVYLKNEWIEDSSEFIFPESNVFTIDASELEGKNAIECKIARNEIYARHGRKFNDEALQGYFNTCIWYEGTIEPDVFSDDILNDVERANLQMITDYETRMGY